MDKLILALVGIGIYVVGVMTGPVARKLFALAVTDVKAEYEKVAEDAKQEAVLAKAELAKAMTQFKLDLATAEAKAVSLEGELASYKTKLETVVGLIHAANVQVPASVETPAAPVANVASSPAPAAS